MPVVQILLPIVLLLLLGRGIAASGIIDAGGWRGIDRLLYFVLFPALIIEAVARAEGGSGEALRLAGCLVAAQAIVTVGGLLLRPVILARLKRSRPAFTSVMQGVVRWNTMVALALVASVHGPEGVKLVALSLSVMIPFANLVSVTVLSIDGDNQSGVDFAAIFSQLLRNPFLISIAVGLIIALSPVKPPEAIGAVLRSLSLGATAIGLIAVGAGLSVRKALTLDPLVLASAALKLVAMPLLAVAIGGAVGLTPMALGIAVLAASVPTASASFVLAREMGGDSELMARIIATHTVAAMATLPLLLMLFGAGLAN
ncbi:MAG: AEC family transporter [Hyphomicrobiaceae bacterium]|nr:AEC family transporter [Hyphomicrobiaceae bacterium]